MVNFHINKALLTACIIFVSVTAHAQQSQIIRNDYGGECQYDAPLTSYERCDSNSQIGLGARACAEKDALDKCQTDPAKLNSNCNVVSSSAYAQPIPRFPGYRQCVGKANAFGYERK